MIHFDAFDHIVGANDNLRYVFAPFSHDAETNKVPEPSSLLLLGSGLLGLAFWGRKHSPSDHNSRCFHIRATKKGRPFLCINIGRPSVA
jgi:hypothetical protein